MNINEGAFALIDCLGFKGIWKNHKPEDVIKKFKFIQLLSDKKMLPSKLSSNFLRYGPVDLQVTLLSDTIAVSIKYIKNNKKELKQYHLSSLVTFMVALVSELIEAFLFIKPVLVLRGCITYGEFLSKGNYFVGPAVDCAAENMNIPQGAFIWLHPTAAEVYTYFTNYIMQIFNIANSKNLAKVLKTNPNIKLDNLNLHEMLKDKDEKTIQVELSKILKPYILSPLLIYDYPMPLKNGQNLICSLVNPLMYHAAEKRRVAIIRKYGDYMKSDLIDVMLKRQNTLKFLEQAKIITDKFYSEAGKIFKVK